MIEFVNENWLVILTIAVAIYEIIARRIPTTGNWSIIHLLAQIADIIIKNKAKTSETDEAGQPVEKTFRVAKRRRG